MIFSKLTTTATSHEMFSVFFLCYAKKMPEMWNFRIESTEKTKSFDYWCVVSGEAPVHRAQRQRDCVKTKNCSIRNVQKWWTIGSIRSATKFRCGITKWKCKQSSGQSSLFYWPAITIAILCGQFRNRRWFIAWNKLPWLKFNGGVRKYLLVFVINVFLLFFFLVLTCLSRYTTFLREKNHSNCKCPNTRYRSVQHKKHLEKIFAKHSMFTAIKWIWVSLMNMDDLWGIFVWFSLSSNMTHSN